MPPKPTTAYCVKCRKMVTMIDLKPITTKNGKKALSGHCHVCKTKMIRFV